MLTRGTPFILQQCSTHGPFAAMLTSRTRRVGRRRDACTMRNLQPYNLRLTSIREAWRMRITDCQRLLCVFKQSQSVIASCIPTGMPHMPPFAIVTHYIPASRQLPARLLLPHLRDPCGCLCLRNHCIINITVVHLTLCDCLSAAP